MRADPVSDAHYDIFFTRPSVTPAQAYQPYASSTAGVSNWWFSPNSKSVAILGTLVPQAQPSLYLSKLPVTGGPPTPVLVSDGNAVVQNDVTWLPGSRVILARAAVTGGVQLFSSRMAEDSTLTGPFSISGQSGTGVTSYQIAPSR